MSSDLNFYKKNGYLVKKNLINQKIINQINKVVNQVVSSEKNKRKKNNVNGTQSYDNYHFVYNSTSSKNKEILRLNNPQNRHKIFYELSRNKNIISIVKKLLGGSVRFHLGKLNFKLPNKKKGSEIGWHQDWAFYPHTNDNVLALGLMLNDVTIDNGPLMVIPESHKGPVLSHNNNGVFCGAINPDDKDFDINKAITLTGKARSMTIHHARTLHGSAPNNSDKDRLMLFYECNSADAWPLVGVGAYLKNVNPVDLCSQMENQMVCGQVNYQPRMENVPVVLPLPPAQDYSSIFTTQKTGGAKSAF